MLNRSRLAAKLCAALALVIALSTFLLPASASWLWNEGSSAVQLSSIEDDGMLRVHLKSLGAPRALGLTLAGIYTLEGDPGFRFARDTEISLAADGENVLLTVGGLTLDMGMSMTLTRHAPADGIGENGVYIHESEKDTLFCGDLSVDVVDGALRAILSIQIEDYLYGVVAYEMSDSFPIEALKAQAVAARTYAMGRKWASGSRAYDVVDTTADQVYKGYDGQYVNVIQAVDDTRGIVGTYNGGFAMCYYTASNGGQTAIANDIWGGSDDCGYLDMRDDPYDLENTKSLVNSLAISADGSGSQALMDMLQARLTDAAAGISYQQIRIDAIASIEPTEPRTDGSYMYTKLRFALTVSTRDYGWCAADGDVPGPVAAKVSAPSAAAVAGLALARRVALNIPYEWALADWAAQPEPLYVELSVYDDIKDGLALGLNGSDYELVSVTAQVDALGANEGYTIEMRRFGHGVGMSQRGAQQMAGSHDFDYLEILGFYYPGMTVERIDWPEIALTSIEALPASVGAARAKPTAKPTPAPLPALGAGEYYAKVNLETASSSLNVREAPSTSARVLDTLSNGQAVIVVAELEDGWAHIRTAELEGYVKLEYLVNQ